MMRLPWLFGTTYLANQSSYAYSHIRTFALWRQDFPTERAGKSIEPVTWLVDQTLNGIGWYDVIRGYKDKSFVNCLCDEQPVEWVSMYYWQLSHVLGVAPADRELLDSIRKKRIQP